MLDRDAKREFFDQIAPQRDRWIEKNSYYYERTVSLLRFLVPADASVLEVGCGTGYVLTHLSPGQGLGIDFSPKMIELARRRKEESGTSQLQFRVDDLEDLQLTEKFDYVILSDLVGDLVDIQKAFASLHQVTHEGSRVVLTYLNFLWEPILKLGEMIGLNMPQAYQNWVSLADIRNFLRLTGFEVVHAGRELIFPKRIPFVSELVNKTLAKLPLLQLLCLQGYVVARPVVSRQPGQHSVSVIVPSRNERDNIRPLVERMPELGSHTEIVFVDGASDDGTVEEIEQVIKDYSGKRDISLIHQIESVGGERPRDGKMLKLGKGDAVRKGFAAARGDVVMILDSDLSVAPEDLPKFYDALALGQGEFINGTRLVYPMQKDAMRFLNKLANHFFGHLFSWLLGQPLKDTLCGTKVLYKADYERIVKNRAHFGDFDPFGDFDLLFGAAKLNLKIASVPVRYYQRVYGDIKIQRFQHGVLLLKMSWIAMRKLKFR